MLDKIQKAIDVIKPVCENLIKEGWEYAQLDTKKWAVPREENLFAVATLYKFEGSVPCIIEFRSTSICAEIEVKFDYPPELDKFKYLSEYIGLLRQFKVPVVKGSETLNIEIRKNLEQFLKGYRKAYDLYRSEIDLKKLKLTLIKRLAEIFGLELTNLDYENSVQSFSFLLERKDIGPTIDLKVITDSNHNISLDLKNLNEEEAHKILSFLQKKNARS